jgi:hypothetical protein
MPGMAALPYLRSILNKAGVAGLVTIAAMIRGATVGPHRQQPVSQYQHVSIKLPLDFLEWAEARARQKRQTRSAIIRDAILEAMNRDQATARV